MKIYCSTGAFIGRINNRNYRLLTDYGHLIDCDGFEFMLFPAWYEERQTLISDLKACGLPFPVLHADKSIGDRISCLDERNFHQCEELWKINLETACELGATKVNTHIWGVPDSDLHLERIYGRVLRFEEIAKSYDIEMLGENCCCIYGSPLAHMLDLLGQKPDLHFTVDTRQAQFHQELEVQCTAEALWHGAVDHLHISDFHGEKKDWNALYPIPAPGEGDVNFSAFFKHLKNCGYDGTLTLESPCMRPDSLDYSTLNAYLDFIRRGLYC